MHVLRRGGEGVPAFSRFSVTRASASRATPRGYHRIALASLIASCLDSWRMKRSEMFHAFVPRVVCIHQPEAKETQPMKCIVTSATALLFLACGYAHAESFKDKGGQAYYLPIAAPEDTKQQDGSIVRRAS